MALSGSHGEQGSAEQQLECPLEQQPALQDQAPASDAFVKCSNQLEDSAEPQACGSGAPDAECEYDTDEFRIK
jgi:hypothetical protein